jgi:hypothetical protein
VGSRLSAPDPQGPEPSGALYLNTTDTFMAVARCSGVDLSAITPLQQKHESHIAAGPGCILTVKRKRWEKYSGGENHQ